MAMKPDSKNQGGDARPNTKPIVAAIIAALIVVAAVVGWFTNDFFERSLETKQNLEQEDGSR